MAEETGGGHFALPEGADLTATFARVAEELRRQYLIGFSPAVHDGKLHRVEVRVGRAGDEGQGPAQLSRRTLMMPNPGVVLVVGPAGCLASGLAAATPLPQRAPLVLVDVGVEDADGHARHRPHARRLPDRHRGRRVPSNPSPPARSARSRWCCSST